MLCLSIQRLSHNRYMSVLIKQRLTLSCGVLGGGGIPIKKRINLIPLRQRIRDFESGGVLCIKPHLCKSSQDRGVPAPVSVCSKCEVQSECRSDGYLSQTPLAQSAQVLCIAQPKLFLILCIRGSFVSCPKGSRRIGSVW